MIGAAMRWLPLLLCCAAVCALPLPDEFDNEDTRKVLGSSVVTSVSVLMENENGTQTAYFADAAGQPVKRPHEGDDIGSPVDLITPDKYQFYTFDGSGNIITRFMTRDEVRSIIANGQKNNAMTQEPPTFYHNLPASPGELAFEPTVEEAPDHFAQAQMKMHSVVASVQNVLKSQMDEKVDTEVQSPMTPDTSASWSMILPSYLGNDAQENATVQAPVTNETVQISTDVSGSSESLPLGDAPHVSSESGSGDSEEEVAESSSAEQQDESSTSAAATVSSTSSTSVETTQSLASTETSSSEPSTTSPDSESDKTADSSESTEITEKQTTHQISSESTAVPESPEKLHTAENSYQTNTDASIAESTETSSSESTASNINKTDSTESELLSGDSEPMADAPGEFDVSVFDAADNKVTHMEVAGVQPPEAMSHTKTTVEVESTEASASEDQRPPAVTESAEVVKDPIDSLLVHSDENNSSFNKVVHSNEKQGASPDSKVTKNDTNEHILVGETENKKPVEQEEVHEESQSSLLESQVTSDNPSNEGVTHPISSAQETTESKEDTSSEETETSKPTTATASSSLVMSSSETHSSEPTPILNNLNVTQNLAAALSEFLSEVGDEALASIKNEETEKNATNTTDTKDEEQDEKPMELIVTSVSSSESSQSSSTSVSSSTKLNTTGDDSDDSDATVSGEETIVPAGNKDHDVVVGSESVIAQILEAPQLSNDDKVTNEKHNLDRHRTPGASDHVESVELTQLTEDSHITNTKIHNALPEPSTSHSKPDSVENTIPVSNHFDKGEKNTGLTKTSIDEASDDKIPIVPYNNYPSSTEMVEITTIRDEGVTPVGNTEDESATEVDIIPVSSEEETEKPSPVEITTEESEGSGSDDAVERHADSEETTEGSGWSPTARVDGSGSGDGADLTDHSWERTTKGYSLKDTYKMTDDALPALTSSEEAYDVNKYVTGPKDYGVKASDGQVAEKENDIDKNADDIIDVYEYANSNKDMGVTTPMNVEEATTLKQQLELNDEAVNFDDHMVKLSSSNDEMSAENIYNVPSTDNDDKDVDVTTPGSDEDLNNTTKADNANDIYDVNNYVNSDKDLGVTTVSDLDDSQTDKPSEHEQNDEEDLSAGNIYDVHNYISSDKDLGVTTPVNDAAQDTTKANNADDIYDVNNYVNSDKDLGVTTTSSVDESQTEKDISNDSAGTTLAATNAVETDSEVETTTLFVSAEESTQEIEVTTEPAEKISSEDVHTRVSSGSIMEISSDSDDDAETTTHFSSEMPMNDQPIPTSSSEDTVESTESNPSQEKVQYYKPTLEGNTRPNSEKLKLGPSGDFQWTKVDTFKSPIKDSATQPSAAVELHPAPEESLGLEASTAHLFEDVQKFADLCNELAFKMWTSLTDKGVSTSRSLVMSPFATTSQLSMLFLGARGPTSGQMNDMLKLDDMMTFNPHQVFRNVTDSVLQGNPGVSTAAFVREIFSDLGRGKMLDFYKQRVSHFYDGHVEEVDFASIGDTLRRRTNLFVKRQTGGKVSEYMRGSSLELQPPLAAFSANIFQTDCSSASTEGRDGEMYFTILPATRQRRLVPIPAVVYRSGFMAGYEPGLDATVVSLGSHDAAISTLLVLPGQQGQLAPGDGLPRLEARLINSSYSDGSWSKLLRSLLPRTGLEVQIPRFSHRSQLNITHSLQTMGLNDLFDPISADLKGLSGSSNDLHVSDVIQLNTFSTCGEEVIGARHHVEVYPSGPNRSGRQEDESEEENLDNVPLVLRPRQARLDMHPGPSGFEDLVQDSIYQMPLALRPRQARLPEGDESLPRLKYDRPFLYFVRHNPTGFILHMGRFNPRLLH